MDISALVAALIGAVGGAIATGIGAFLRSRTTRRTAARLVYAELDRNSAGVAFYRTMGAGPVSTTSDAWHSYGETLARDRQAATFQTVSQGYAALEAVAYIAETKTLSKQDSTLLLEENVRRLCDALHLVSKVAQIPDKQLKATISRLNAIPIAEAADRQQAANAPPSLKSELLDIQIATGQAPGTALVKTEVVRIDRGSTSTTALAGVAIQVYDAAGSETFPPSRRKLVRTEAGPPSDDVTAEETFNALVQTIRFFREVLGRDSLDETAAPAVAIVHYGKNYDNSFWDGQQLIVGDGDGSLFGRFSACIEVLAHELSHVLTQQAGLRFQAQPGALNESIADVMGLLVKQYALGQSVDESDWLVGAGLLAPGIAGEALRSLRSPGTAYDDKRLGKDAQPAHMSDYVRTKTDNGGVHINSGIPNHAFYLLATRLGGYAWEKAGMIWYRTLISKALAPTATFQAFAGLTVAVARRDYVEDPSVASAVEAAWREVGITPRQTKQVVQLGAARPARK